MNEETWALEYKVAGQSACGNGYVHAVCNMQGKAFQPSFRRRKTEMKIKTRKTMQKKEVEEGEKMLQRHAIEKHGVSRWCIDTRQGKARRNTMQL